MQNHEGLQPLYPTCHVSSNYRSSTNQTNQEILTSSPDRHLTIVPQNAFLVFAENIIAPRFQSLMQDYQDIDESQ